MRSTARPWSTRGAIRAFTLVDMLVLILGVGLLVAWLGLGRTGERGRTARCSGNLATLGKAMYSFAHEHSSSVPFAGVNVDTLQSSWDVDVFTYLGSGQAKANNADSVPRLFACPSDNKPRKGTTRSYAMAGNDMSPEKWPPGLGSATGIGLLWDKNSVTTLLGEEALTKRDLWPTINIHDIPVPSDTVLITELISPNNVMGSARECNVIGASRQREGLRDDGASVHYGKFNYLMVDGHVERLSPLQTGSYDGTAGVWSLKK